MTGIARPPSSSQRHELDEDGFPHVGRTNTRRHIRSSPSTGNAVATVPEVDEDDGSNAAAAAGVTNRLRNLSIVPAEEAPGGEGEGEVADVPVIVMDDLAAREHAPPAQGGDDHASPFVQVEAEGMSTQSTEAEATRAERNPEHTSGDGESSESAEIPLTQTKTTESGASSSTHPTLEERAVAGENERDVEEGGVGVESKELSGSSSAEGVVEANANVETKAEGEAESLKASTIYDEVDENELFEEPILPSAEDETQPTDDGMESATPSDEAGEANTEGHTSAETSPSEPESSNLPQETAAPGEA